ncbi:hypothetical protein GCM10023197_08130 [Gordonia humi]
MVVGAILVVIGLTVFAEIRAVPAWHRGSDPLPGSDLRWITPVVACAAVVPALVHFVARPRRSRRWDRADIGVSVLGVAAIVVLLAVSAGARDDAAGLQAAPGVIDRPSIVVYVAILGIAIGVGDLLSRVVRVPQRGRRRAARRFATAAVCSSAILATVAVFVAWPAGPSPRLDGPDGRQASGDAPVRIDWDEPAPDAQAWEASIPAPVAGGFALPGATSVTAYADGRQNWRLDFDARVVGAWGAPSATRDESWLLVQVEYPAPVGLLTYGVDGRDGTIRWRTDALDGAEAVRVSADGAVALTDDESALVRVRRSDGTVDRIADLDVDDDCRRPDRFDVIGDEFAVPLVCAGRPDRFAVYSRTGERRIYGGADLGASVDESVRVVAGDRGVAAIMVSGNGVLTTRFASSEGARQIADVPDGWTVTGLIARGRDEWTVTAVDTDGHGAVLYATPAQAKTVVVRTGARSDPTRDDWTRVGDSLAVVAPYDEPQDVGGVRQATPLTYVGAPIPGSGTDRTAPAVTVTSDPCRPASRPADRLFAVDGAGTLIRCSGETALSREWIWIP